MNSDKVFSKNVLLTGAGFTKNFGGFLAEEMWAQIFSHEEVQKNWKIVEKMQKEFNYENVYYEIIQGGQSDLSNSKNKEAIHKAMMDAYENLDYIIRNRVWFEAGLYALLNLFSGNENEIGCFFTLNQDLLIERRFSEGPLTKNLKLSGLDMEFWKLRGINPLIQENFIYLPNDDVDIELSKDSLNYIKLHGSYNWKSRRTGFNAMVLGINKKEAIEEEPLLKKYYDIFKEVLSQKSVKLLIIGYGFADEHINKIIYESINSVEQENEKLKLFVLSPETPSSFKERLCNRNNIKVSEWHPGETIFSRLSGYFHYDLGFLHSLNYESELYFKMIEKIFKS